MTMANIYRSGNRFPAILAFMLLLVFAGPRQSEAQVVLAPDETSTQPLTLTVDEAIQIALVSNYALQNIRLDVQNASAQVREAWGQVLPQVNASSSYTRNLKSANPFSGSAAGGLFQSFGFIDWLSYNEQARTDADPSTDPLSFDEFQQRRQEGMSNAGISLSGEGDNPFAVPNQFTSGISIEQTLFNQAAFAAISGAERLKQINQLGADRQEQVLIDQVRQAFYQALLADEQAQVSTQSVVRTRQTMEEVSKRVVQGVTPKFERLSTEVELANLETQLVQLQNQASLAVDNLKMTLGIPVEQPVRLRGALQADDQGAFLSISAEDATEIALRRRPDIDQAQLAIDLRQIDKKLTRAQYYPSVSAFANLNYIGNVPSNRTFTVSDPSDPFSFSQQTNGFFSQSYWNPSVGVGLRLSWNIFNGFQTSSQVQQRQIAVDRARIEYEQKVQNVRLEVRSALRNLQAAQQRIDSQKQNVSRAELNYQYAQARLSEGVATQLEERNASEQLDQSRLNYLQAVYDYLVARGSFETAIGVPMADPNNLRLTSN